MRKLRRIALLILFIIIIFAWAGGTDFSSLLSDKPSNTSKIKSFFSKNIKSTLVIPDIHQNSEDPRLYPKHWKGDLGYFVLLRANVETRLGPDNTANTYKSLEKTQRVRVLFEQGGNVLNDPHRQGWVFLANEMGETYLGWVLAETLLLRDDFKRVNSFQTLEISFEKGEYAAQIKMDKYGGFVSHWHAEGSGLKLKGKDTGYLYVNDDILWAKKQKQDDFFDFFIIDKDVSVQHEYRFNKWKIEHKYKELNDG